MTHTQLEPIDRPFPGARPQVPGTRGEPAARALDSLPLEATQAGTEQHWTVRLPVRAEQVSVSKQVVIRERVVVRRRAVEELAQIDDQVAREVLRLESEGEVELDSLDAASHRGRRTQER